MKVEYRNGEWLFVAQCTKDNNAIASLVRMLGNSNLDLTDDEVNNFGCGFNSDKPMNYIYIPDLIKEVK